MICIVLPIYNAYEDLKKCVSSVLACTEEGTYRLLMINDASPDERIAGYLDEMKKKYPEKIETLTNKENLGFVKTCNKGICYYKENTVILNSDTEVTPGWLDNLQRAAQSNPFVASVTPLSNNATLASVPIFLEENKIPDRITLDTAAKIVKDIAEPLYLQLPTGMGYCMYMTRKAIDAVGELDDENFGRGYGEENDWCFRASQQGFVHLLCDDTYIYHKGTASFLDTKGDRIRNSENYLSKTYPEQTKELSGFLLENPLSDIQKHIENAFTMLNTNQKGILYVLHNSPFHDENSLRGGTEYHVQELIEQMPDEMIYVLYPSLSNRNVILLTCYFNGKYKEIFVRVGNRIDLSSLYNKELERTIVELLSILPLKAVHIQQWVRLGLDIFEACKKSRIPYYVTLHDYYSVCPRIHFLNENEEYCGRVERDCGKCLRETLGVGEGYIQTWREHMHGYLKGAAGVYTPSEYVVTEIKKWYPDVEVKAREHGVCDYVKEDTAGNASDTLRVALTGNMQPSKGSGVLISMLQEKLPDWLEIHIFGEILDSRINRIMAEQLVVHGGYKRDQLPRLLSENKIDLVLLPSIWPETYSYTLSEAIQAGCPVVSLDIGALGERIQKMDCGYILPIGSNDKDYVQMLYHIHENRQEFEEKRQKTKTIRFPTRGEVAQQYLLDYNKTGENLRYECNIAHLKKILSKMQSNSEFEIRKGLAEAKGIGLEKIRDIYVSNLYVDTGDGFNENSVLKADMPFDNHFRIVYNLEALNEVKALRWDPVEGLQSRLKITGITVCTSALQSYKIEPDNLVHNGLKMNGYVQFSTQDPYFMLPVIGKVNSVEIEGEFETGMALCPKETRLYINRGEGLSENDKRTSTMPVTPGFQVDFNLGEPQFVESVRWDPIELNSCTVRIENACSYGPGGKTRLTEYVHNGTQRGNIIAFETKDPWIVFPVNDRITDVEIEGIWIPGMNLNVSDIHSTDVEAIFNAKESRLYIDVGNGLSENDCVVTGTSDASRFTLEFDLGGKIIKKLRWDPAENPCTVWINNISVRKDGSLLPLVYDKLEHNGVSTSRGAVFETNDPWFMIPVTGITDSIIIEGYWIV